MFVCFDLDHTLLRKNSSVELCRFLYKKGVFSFFSVSYAILCYVRHRYFWLSLEAFQRKVFKRILQGRSLHSLSRQVDDLLSVSLGAWLYPPALEALEEAKKRGDTPVLLSSGPDFLVKPIAKRLGIEKVWASKYEADDEGNLLKIALVLSGQEKARLVKEWQGCFAYSDSVLDLPFLEASTHPIVVSPDRKLRRIAKQRGWKQI